LRASPKGGRCDALAINPQTAAPIRLYLKWPATAPISACRGSRMSYRAFDVRRIAGALGAELAGVDLSEPLDDSVIAEIRRALLDHQVIFFGSFEF
jgi:hypothetical protein